MKDQIYIERELTADIGNIDVEYYQLIDSTNDYLLGKLYTHKYHFCYADSQTKGRGRRGSKWVSENKDNIYSTLGFHCNFSIAKDSLRSVKVALGVLEAIKLYIPQEFQRYLKVKLPNDIYFKDQKIAGILIETKNIKKTSFDIIIGVGINVNMLDIGENIDRHWTSLAIINKTEVNISKVIVSLVKSIIKHFDKQNLQALQEFSEYDFILDKSISFKYFNKVYQGIAKGVSKDLKLLLLDNENSVLEFDLVSVSKIRVIK